jgi:hypothetical protein
MHSASNHCERKRHTLLRSRRHLSQILALLPPDATAPPCSESPLQPATSISTFRPLGLYRPLFLIPVAASSAPPVACAQFATIRPTDSSSLTAVLAAERSTKSMYIKLIFVICGCVLIACHQFMRHNSALPRVKLNQRLTLPPSCRIFSAKFFRNGDAYVIGGFEPVL